MKLIIAGASGFVGKELVRQSLQNPKITSVVALSRTPVEVASGLESSAVVEKLKQAQVNDYDVYTEEVKHKFASADACIWTIAITPTKSKDQPMEKVRRVCHDFTMTGLHTMFEASHVSRRTTPFRFLYMSGIAAERDQTKTPQFNPQYSLMRGETENSVLDFAAKHAGEIESCVAKPGMILKLDDPPTTREWQGKPAPSIVVGDLAKAMLDQVLHGFEKEPLYNADLVAIAERLRSQ